MKKIILLLLTIMIVSITPVYASEEVEYPENVSLRGASTLKTFNVTGTKTFTGIDINGVSSSATVTVVAKGNYIYTPGISPSYSDFEFTSVSRSHSNVTSSSFETVITNKTYEVSSSNLYICITIRYSFGRGYLYYTFRLKA